MNIQEQLLALADIKLSLKNKVLELQNNITDTENTMAELLASNLDIDIGYEFQHLGKTNRVLKFVTPIWSNSFGAEFLELHAECLVLKKDGEIDTRIKPQYNIVFIKQLRIR